MINPFLTWIKLPRDFVDWQWYTNSNMVHIYLNLLLNANLADTKRNGIIVHRGEYFITLTLQGEETGLSQQSIRTCLSNLKKSHEICFRKINRGRIIVLPEFNKFQPIGMDEQNPSWIKLYRKLCEWNWYKSPHMVHLIVHFMLKGEPILQSDGKVLWQLTTSYKMLNKETGMSIQTLRSCIKKLKNAGEIAVLVFPTHQFSIVTLCNYNSYEDEKIAANTMVTQCQHGGNTILEGVEIESKLPLLTHLKQDSTTCSYDSYDDKKIETNTMVTQYQHNGNTVSTPFLADNLTQCQHDGNTISTPLKEYKKERIKESSSSSFRAQEKKKILSENIEFGYETEKENEQKKVEKESLFDDLKSNGVWLKAMAMKFNLADIKQVINKLDEFQLDLVCRGRDYPSSLQDCMSHFNDWLAINIKRTTVTPAPSTRAKEKWAGEYFVPKSSEGGIYDGKI
nr:hypothetical protein [uncultured Lachnoclostridium sp.]